MTNHQKRLSVPNSWPVERKTETFTVKAGAGPHGEAGVPLLIVLRDVLGYADTRKEARYALDQDSVLINGTPVSDEERPVGMFDILAFAEREEYYRVFPGEGGRLSLTAIDADAAGSKLGKVVEKRHVPGGDVQLTLHDGRTLVVDDTDYDGGDSVVVSNDDSEVVAHFEYEEGALVTAVDGEHAGEVGTVDAIQVTPGSADNIVRVTQDGDAGFETVEDYVVVIDENFTDDDAAADTDVEDEPDETDVDADESEADDEDDADESEADDAEDDADESEADDAEDGESEADADESEADADDAEASEADADDGGDEQ
jgi:small subunit ribosomal protein S4e